MAKQKLQTELTLDNKDFIGGLQDAEGGVGKFGKAIAGMAVALGAAGAVFKVLLDWIRATDFGMQAFNVTTGVTKQLLTDLITGEGFHIKEAIKNANAQTKIHQDNAKEGYIVAKMQKELNLLIVEAADQTKSLAEKKKALTDVMAKEHELKTFLIEDAKEEKKAAWDLYKVNQSNTDAREKFFAAAAKLEEVQGMDSRRLMSQYTGVLEQQAQRARDLADAFTETKVSLEDLKKGYKEFFASTQNMVGLPQNNKPKSVFEKKTFGLSPSLKDEIQKYSGTSDQDIADNMAAGVESLTDSLTEQEEVLLELSGAFASLFSNVDEGFKGMITSAVENIKRLAFELLAQAAILTLLSVITGVPLSKDVFKNLLPSGFQGLSNGPVSGLAAGGIQSQGSNVLTATLKAKDIQIALQRID